MNAPCWIRGVVAVEEQELAYLGKMVKRFMYLRTDGQMLWFAHADHDITRQEADEMMRRYNHGDTDSLMPMVNIQKAPPG